MLRALLNAGLPRAAAAVAVLLLLGYSGFTGMWPAYLAVLGALAFGALLVLGRPAVLQGSLPRVLVDSVLITLLVGATGGVGSPFFVLYLLAALGIARIPDTPRKVVGGATVVVGYLAAVTFSSGLFAALSPMAALVAGATVLLCGVAGLLGAQLTEARERSRVLSGTLESERRHAAGVSTVAASFGSVLEVLTPEALLQKVAETAREVSEARYAHAAVLESGRHRTVADGDLEACPSWWHPSIQRLVLRSCRSGGTLWDGEEVHGLEAFLAVPMIPPGGEGLGALVVGGTGFGDEERRTLELLAGEAAAVLLEAEDAPAGRDPVSRLPNKDSLRRVLARDFSQSGSLTVMAADLEGFRHYNRTYGPAAGDTLLARLGRHLGGSCQRLAFRYKDDVFVLLFRGQNEARNRRSAVGIQQVVAELTGGSRVSLGVSVGFAGGGAGDHGPEVVLQAALRALRRAKIEPERIFSGTPDRTGEAWVPEVMEYSPRVTQTVLSLVEATEARDSYVSGHMRAVSDIARRLGTWLELSAEQMDALVVGALLHDVGKIGVPDSILQKPGKLTEQEYETMKQHPVTGAKILEPVEELEAVLPVVRHHHEHFEGGGYPAGLRGEEIPLIARITLVADALDSMTRDRVYRRGIPLETAVEEIVNGSGTQFDPRVVRALVELIDSGRWSMERAN